MEDFWERWLKANELKKVEMIKTLPIAKDTKIIHKGFEHTVATLLNSYLVDLKDYLTKDKE